MNEHAYIVTSSVQLTGLTIQTFDARAQEAFKTGLAVFLGVTSDDIEITGFLSASRMGVKVPGRRLLESSLSVEFSVSADSRVIAEGLAGELSSLDSSEPSVNELVDDFVSVGLHIEAIEIEAQPEVVQVANEDSVAHSYPSSTVPGSSTAQPYESSVVPGSTAHHSYPSSTVPGSSTAQPAPSSTVPGSSTAQPYESSVVPGSSTAQPAPSSTIPGSTTAQPARSSTVPVSTYDVDATYVRGARATARLVGFDLALFDKAAEFHFRTGIAFYLSVDVDRVFIIGMFPSSSASRRLLVLTGYIDVEFVVSASSESEADQLLTQLQVAEDEGSDEFEEALTVVGDLQLSYVYVLPGVYVFDLAPSPTAHPYMPSSSTTPSRSSTVSTVTSDCVQSGTQTDLSMYDDEGSLQMDALDAAQSFAEENGLKVPDADMFVRAKICNAPQMSCCSDLGWRQDNMLRFPYVCGDSAGCELRMYEDAKRNCVALGAELCRGNAVSTSMNDPTCKGTKTDYVWTLTRCDVNGVEGRVIRPSAGGAPGPLCETNLLALHQSRCCSNVC